MSEVHSGIRPPSGAPPRALPLSALVAVSNELEAVRRSDLAPGDRLIVSTRNSIYTLVARADGRFAVSGGLYSREGRDGGAVTVNGCTAGGRAIFTGIVAAPGLYLELGDGTVTTRIRRVRRIPAGFPVA
jgi:hypothetical protein